MIEDNFRERALRWGEANAQQMIRGREIVTAINGTEPISRSFLAAHFMDIALQADEARRGLLSKDEMCGTSIWSDLEELGLDPGDYDGLIQAALFMAARYLSRNGERYTEGEGTAWGHLMEWRADSASLTGMPIERGWPEGREATC